MGSGHVPLRMCRGCGKRAPQRDLQRLVLREGTLVEDRDYTAPGRGVYCCKNGTCRNKLVKNKKVLKRVFRLKIDEFKRTGAINEQDPCL